MWAADRYSRHDFAGSVNTIPEAGASLLLSHAWPLWTPHV